MAFVLVLGASVIVLMAVASLIVFGLAALGLVDTSPYPDPPAYLPAQSPRLRSDGTCTCSSPVCPERHRPRGAHY